MTETPWCYANDPLVINIPVDQGDDAQTPLPTPIDLAVAIAQSPSGVEISPTVTSLPGDDVILDVTFDADQLDETGAWIFQVRITKDGIPSVAISTIIEVRNSLF